MIPAMDSGPPLTVLIADPHEDGAESLDCLLRLYGHEVTTARTGGRRPWRPPPSTPRTCCS